MEMIRTIITQDAEVDDQNSLRHVLLYSNDIEIQGIVQTSSIFHWIGSLKGVTPEGKPDYTKAYRWTGTDWMQSVLDDYEAVYPNLKVQDNNYPSVSYLRSITKIGNIGYPGEMDMPTEGSSLIKERIMDNDPRKLYIQVWGGTNTIARALFDIQQEYQDKDNWLELKNKIENKVVLTACGEQDDTYKEYISEVFPNIQFVRCLQMKSYAYLWSLMPEGKSKDTLKADFMKNHILNKGPLLEKYATWLDGMYYEGEPEKHQFGANKELQKTWWGLRAHAGPYKQYDFLSEGDSPTFLCLLPWGLRTLENFSNGSISGRYIKDESMKNSKGQNLNYWIQTEEDYTGYFETKKEESMFYYVEKIQKDFAARGTWCVSSSYQEHPPVIEISTDDDIIITKPQTCTIHINPQNDVEYQVRYYKDASNYEGELNYSFNNNTLLVEIPSIQKNGELHFIIEASNKFGYEITRYKQIIIYMK